MAGKASVVLENGLNLSQVLSSGSILQINNDFDDSDNLEETEKSDIKTVDFIGQPVKSFEALTKILTSVDAHGLVKKKIVEEGGGLPLPEDGLVSIAFSGYWEGACEPFDIRKPDRPLVLELKENGLLPGLQMAVRSMLVGEMSVFLLSYNVMYGEMGIPPRIKSKTDCVFYIKLLKCTLPPKQGTIDFTEPNVFQKVLRDARLLYSNGLFLYKTKNFPAAIQLFRKCVFMLHKVRLADEEEEKVQEKFLKKLYINLAISYNCTKQPLKVCIACNELNRLDSLWNNGKALFQNAKALRMIGQYDAAEKRILRAMRLNPENEDIKKEHELINKTRESCNQSKLIVDRIIGASEASDDFKQKVDELIKNFKENANLCKLTLPEGLDTAEIDYVKEACKRENLFYNKIHKNYALDKDEELVRSNSNLELLHMENTFQDTDEDASLLDDGISVISSELL